MLIDDIADRIAIACPAELDEVVKGMWGHHFAGALTVDEAEVLDEAARTRREAIQARQTKTRPKPRAAPSNASRASARSERRLQRPREKLFGNGRLVPLDREAKNRIQVLMRALTHPTEPGKHYGAVTAKAEAVGRVLLWVFHNAGTGRCFPSYEAIAKEAGCHRDTVAEAIKMLEAAGILTWCNRRARVRIGGATKVVRTSNSYRFIDPGSKSEFPSETSNQDHLPLRGTGVRPPWGIPDSVYDDRSGIGGGREAARR
jgi:hypothetical protein